ncbi:MAG: hypothetical protein KDI61_06575 [Alphaproteobacteria bacterium]|nr:hypothetical protein [Alphaproteobacteria bacterium]MCB1839907.1 hypothetical protein [Alphaproteobacteria bacterium]
MRAQNPSTFERSKKPLLALVLSVSLINLTACGVSNFQIVTSGIAAATQGIFSDPKVNLREKNYAAADYLLQQSGNYLNRTGVIEAKPLSESDNPAAPSALGRKISDDVGMRLSELGYNVNRVEVATPVDKGLYGGPEAYPEFLLTGSYLKKKEKIEVYLRLIDTKEQKIISAFDYSMPYDSEIRRLSDADTQIFRTQPK